MNRLLLLLAVVLMLSATSCIAPKRIKYMQLQEKALNEQARRDSLDLDSLIAAPLELQRPDYQVQVNDILSIHVRSLDPETDQLFNKQNMAQGGNQFAQFAQAGLYLQGYSIDNRGLIDIPILGEVKVVGKTISEIKTFLEDTLTVYYQPGIFVNVQLSGIRYAVVGEVRRPGQNIAFQNQLNIYEAIALAGDINFEGDRREVQLMRQYPDGVRVHTLDLTNREIIKSPFYFVLPNDVINVNPLPQRSLGIGTTAFNSFVQTVTLISNTFLIINLLSNGN